MGTPGNGWGSVSASASERKYPHWPAPFHPQAYMEARVRGAGDFKHVSGDVGRGGTTEVADAERRASRGDGRGEASGAREENEPPPRRGGLDGSSLPPPFFVFAVPFPPAASRRRTISRKSEDPMGGVTRGRDIAGVGSRGPTLHFEVQFKGASAKFFKR